DVQLAKDATVKDLLAKRAKDWKDRAARYESEPKPDNKGEGRKELMARALKAEAKRDHAMATYHNFEFASAAFQIAIVLASSYLMPGLSYRPWGGGGLGRVGLLFSLLAIAAPNALAFLGGP